MSKKWKKKGTLVTTSSSPLLTPKSTSPPPAGQGDNTAKDAAEFAWNVHGYTNEYIRFADGKAGVIMAWCVALIGALFSARAHFYFLVWPDLSRWEWRPTLLCFGSLMSFVLLILGVLAGLGAIVPRLRSRLDKKKPWSQRLQEWRAAQPPSAGLIYWGQVLAQGDQDTYWKNLSEQAAGHLGRAVSDHVFTLAQIANEKYRCINLSIVFAFLGSVAAVAMLVLVSAWPPA